MMRTAFAVLMLTACAGAAMAEEDHSMFWYARAKIACIADATRLCSSAMPDSDKVRECMKDKKALVSPSCAEFYPGGKNAD